MAFVVSNLRLHLLVALFKKIINQSSATMHSNTRLSLTLLLPLAYAQNQAHFSQNQQLRGPILISDLDVDEDVVRNGDVGSTDESSKVNLIILTEAGCSDCQESLAGPLNDMISTPGFANMLNVRQFSFGNHYFVTEKCGGTGLLNQTKTGYNLNYNANTRHCWAMNCINTANPPMDDCFGPGHLVTQHGPKEMEYNKMQACAQKVAGYDNWQPYWPFLICTEANYGSPFDYNTIETATKCAKEEGSYYQEKISELLECYKGIDGIEALLQMAKNTFDHPGTPTILVNGGTPMLSGFWANATAAEVCSQYNGSLLPPACTELLEKQWEFMSKSEKAIDGIVHGNVTCHDNIIS